MNPRVENDTSPATIIITPAVIVAMMATRRHDGVSRRKRKAKVRTKASEDDLHMAKICQLISTGGPVRHTVECQGDKFQ